MPRFQMCNFNSESRTHKAFAERGFEFICTGGTNYGYNFMLGDGFTLLATNYEESQPEDSDEWLTFGLYDKDVQMLSYCQFLNTYGGLDRALEWAKLFITNHKAFKGEKPGAHT